MLLKKTKSDEFVRVRKDEWDKFCKDVELSIQRYKESLEKIKDLTKENNMLKEKLKSATERLARVEQEATVDLQQTSATLQRMQTNISRVLQETEKEIEKSK